MNQGAVNEQKKLEEGAFCEKQLCWGIYVDAATESEELQEVKVQKIKARLADPAYDHGNKRVEIVEVQRVTGDLQYAAIANVALKPELGAAYRLLSTLRGSAAAT